MVIGVPREVPRQKPEGFGRGTFRGTPFHHDTPKALPQIFILLASRARIRDFFQPMDLLYCTVLYCTVLYCTVLYRTVLYCTVLYCIIFLGRSPIMT